MTDEAIDNREKERVMRTKTKVVGMCVVVILVLVSGAIMLDIRKEHKRWSSDNPHVLSWRKSLRNNEIFAMCNLQFFSPFAVEYVEKPIFNADGSVQGKEVFFMNTSVLAQSYCIENHTVLNYRWDGELENTFHSDINLVEWLMQNNNSSQSSENGNTLETIPAVTVISVENHWMPNDDFRPSKTEDPDLSIDALHILKWSGAMNEIPPAVMAFCAKVQAEVNNPKYAKNNPLSWKSKKLSYGKRIYPSYLRAVPLCTEEDHEQTKDIPFIDLEASSYHAYLAICSPYMLVPIPEKDFSFPELGKPYEPGRDKVKVKFSGWYFKEDVYFLIETFKGEGWKN